MKNPYYITTAIDYVNGKPHIGHALEKVLVDALARYHRARGEDVFLLMGADEHGTKIARAAEAAGKSPQAFADEMSREFRGLKDALNLSWDAFIRTTDRDLHWPGVLKMWQALSASGDIYKKSYRGLYCVGHEAFVTEKDLVDGICADHKKPPETIEEENYFFRLSKYTSAIREKIESGEFRIFPESRRNEILSLLEQGLSDVSFSRPRESLSWGVPVPGDESQTMYVWADALTNYISAIGYGREGDPQAKASFEKWWPAEAQMIGKDILRFHAAIWPAMLLSAGLPLPKRLLVHGFITVEGEKMSKTVGNVIDPAELVRQYGADPVRYYLLREIPSGEDGDWSDRKFRALYNGDLANGIGNFASRVLALAAREGELRPILSDPALKRAKEEAGAKVWRKVEEFKFHEELAAIWEFIAAGDEYVNRMEAWKIESPEKRQEVLGNLVAALEAAGRLLLPFLPATAEKILKNIIPLEGGMVRAEKGDPLFPRIV